MIKVTSSLLIVATIEFSCSNLTAVSSGPLDAGDLRMVNSKDLKVLPSCQMEIYLSVTEKITEFKSSDGTFKYYSSSLNEFVLPKLIINIRELCKNCIYFIFKNFIYH